MCSPCFRPKYLLFCASLLLIHPSQSNSQQTTQPQLVRLSYVQGDVTFSPGKSGKPDLGTQWLQAPRDLTLEEGYSVATEDGRAIVEFENGSLVYLAEHSVLQFQKLQLKSGVTNSRLQLLTGTATLAHVSDGRDQMVIETPTAKLTERDTQTLRLDSTLNGTIVHAIDSPLPIDETKQHSKSQLKPGDAIAYIDGLRFPLKGPLRQPPNDPWDQWVNAQQLQRAADLQKGLQESGLKEPVPGLADLVRSGHFFDCPPYGKCWEPNTAPAEPALGSSPEATPNHPQAPNPAPGPRNFVINRTLVGRCPMQSWMYSVGHPSKPGMLNVNEPEEFFHASAFPWSSCFAGSWLVDSCWTSNGSTWSNGFPFYGGYVPWSAVNESCRNRLVYVVGHRHKRHPPICRIHTPHGQGFVPQHPLDHHGKPPNNAKSGVFVLAFEKNNVEARFESGPAKAPLWGSDSPKPLDAPKNLTLTGAKSATPPLIEGRLLQVNTNPGSVAKAIPPSLKEETNIRYDYESKSFVAPRSLTPASEHNNVAGKSDGAPVVVARVGSHGVSGGVTGHGTGSGSGSSGSHSSSSSSPEGASHSSASSGASSSAGGGHSGGSSSSATSSSSSSSNSGASSASSSSHH